MLAERRQGLISMNEGALRREIQTLDPELFELLIHELVVAEYPGQWRKLRAPDGGADSVRHSSDGTADWVVQCKRYATFSTAQQRKCADSLDAAVKRWDPGRVTFVLALDFTATQDRRFREIQAATTAVDALTLTDVLRLATKHSGVTARFVGPDAKTITETIERSARMGGAALLDGNDLLARGHELARFGDEVDPRFKYGLSVHAPDGSQPRWDHPPYLTTIHETPESRLLLHSWIREAARPFPGVHFEESNEGRAALQEVREALAQGRSAFVDARLVNMTVPKLYEEIREGPDLASGQIEFLPAAAVEYEVTLRSAEHGTLCRRFAMRRVIPTNSTVDVAFVAWEDGLWFELGVEFVDRGARFHLGAGAPQWCTGARRMEQSLRWLLAFYEHEQVTVRDVALDSSVSDGRLPLPLPPDASERVRESIELLKLLAEIEAYVHQELPLPDTVTPPDAHDIARVAHLIRSGGGHARVDYVEIGVPRESIDQLPAEGRLPPQRRRRTETVCGVELDLGDEILTYPLLRVDAIEELTPPDPMRVCARLVPVDPNALAEVQLITEPGT